MCGGAFAMGRSVAWPVHVLCLRLDATTSNHNDDGADGAALCPATARASSVYGAGWPPLEANSFVLWRGTAERREVEEALVPPCLPCSPAGPFGVKPRTSATSKMHTRRSSTYSNSKQPERTQSGHPAPILRSTLKAEGRAWPTVTAQVVGAPARRVPPATRRPPPGPPPRPQAARSRPPPRRPRRPSPAPRPARPRLPP